MLQLSSLLCGDKSKPCLVCLYVSQPIFPLSIWQQVFLKEDTLKYSLGVSGRSYDQTRQDCTILVLPEKVIDVHLMRP